MKLRYLIIIMISISFLIIGCNNINNQGDVPNENTSNESSIPEKEIVEYKKITPQEARELLAENKEVVLLDVRTIEEYEENHIPGSTLIPLDRIKNEAEAKLTNENAPILVYCRSGRRSKIASNELINMGYKNVFDLGGINDWPYETEKGKDE